MDYAPYRNAWNEDLNAVLGALHAAARCGNENISRSLLKHGSYVNAHELGPILIAGFVTYRSEVWDMLIGLDVNVNEQGGCFGNALLAATILDPYRLVGIALKKGIYINKHGRIEPLQIQSLLRSVVGSSIPYTVFKEEEVTSLCEHLPHDKEPKYAYCTALQVASLGFGHAVGLLLDHGADVNAPAGTYGTALQAGLKAKHYDSVWVVKTLLLDAGDPPGGAEDQSIIISMGIQIPGF